MDTKTVKQINQIDAKRQLGLPLTAEEEALFELYGIPLTQPKQEEGNPDIEPSEETQKTAFVHSYLSPLLQAAGLNVKSAEYRRNLITCEEIVTVTYNNDYTKDVCVTADSLRAIITDVMAQV